MGSIRNTLRAHLTIWGIYLRSLGKWTAVSVVTGTLCGLLGSAFHIGVEYATQWRGAHPWLLYCLPVLGLGIVALYKLLGTEGQGTNSILEEVQSGRGLPPALVPAIFVSTLLTHLGGGSVGREGAALQMGGTLGFCTARLLRLDDRDMRTATITGMAAFFAALFGTPMAATVFALGVVSVGLVYHAALIPALLASLTAYGISRLLGVEPTCFAVTAPAPAPVTFLRVAVLATLCAMLSIVLCETVHGAEKLAERKIGNPWLRVALGGAAIAALTLACGTTDYNGAGMGVIAAAVEQGRAVPWAFALKLLFTVVTLAAGYKGGEVVPSFFIGATFGCAVGPLLGLPAGFAAAVGLVAVFCGAVNCPLASTFLAVELFGAEGMLYFALACALSFVLSGYSGLYSSQRILYDKLKARYIDARTNAYREGRGDETPQN